MFNFFIKLGSKEQASHSYLRLTLIFNVLVCRFNWIFLKKRNGIFVLFSFPNKEEGNGFCSFNNCGSFFILLNWGSDC